MSEPIICHLDLCPNPFEHRGLPGVIHVPKGLGPNRLTNALEAMGRLAKTSAEGAENE